MGCAGSAGGGSTAGGIRLIAVARFLVTLLSGSILLFHAQVSALQIGTEQPSQDTIIYGIRAPRWAGQLTVLSVNALFGGLTAGVIQELRGGSFKDGFTRGALGGTFAYAGKRIAADRFEGAGFLGREVAAVGASVIRNASEGQPTFARLALPLGPVRLNVYRTNGLRIEPSLDVVAALWVAWGIAEPDLEFVASESLSAGTPVFRTNNKLIVHESDRRHAGGFAAAGIVMQSYIPAWGKPRLERILAHERVHVEQEDQLYLTLIEPLENWLIGKLPRGGTITKVIDINATTELIGLLKVLFPQHSSRPWELEAIYLSR
jgi:hypothetical protein